MELPEIPPQVIILMAGFFFILGYLVINQKALRILLLTGTGFYLWYYFVAAERPLWEAIAMSSLMGCANLIGLAGLFLRDSRLIVPKRHRDIYQWFPDVPPGEFRALMKMADRRVVDTATVITREGQPVAGLWFVASGRIEIDKQGERFTMPAGVFVGEVAFLTGMAASATTTLSEGTEILAWDAAALRRRGKRKPRFLMALEAMISRDLAAKVALAVAPANARGTERAEALRAELDRARGGGGSRPTR